MVWENGDTWNGKSKSLGVHRGVVNNITQTIQSIQQAVQDAETSSGMKISESGGGNCRTASSHNIATTLHAPIAMK